MRCHMATRQSMCTDMLIEEQLDKRRNLMVPYSHCPSTLGMTKQQKPQGMWPLGLKLYSLQTVIQ